MLLWHIYNIPAVMQNKDDCDTRHMQQVMQDMEDWDIGHMQQVLQDKDEWDTRHMQQVMLDMDCNCEIPRSCNLKKMWFQLYSQHIQHVQCIFVSVCNSTTYPTHFFAVSALAIMCSGLNCFL